MRVLMRLLPFFIVTWAVCYFFYSLGKKRATDEQKRKGGRGQTKRKHVDSKVVEDEDK